MSGFDSDTIDKILALAESKMIKVGTRDYLQTIYGVEKIMPPCPSEINVCGFQGVLDFMDTEGISTDNVYLHVMSPTRVELISKIEGEWKTRARFVYADAHECQFVFGRYYDHESFIIALMTHFEQDEVTADLLSKIGNISDGTVIGRDDDGVTQEVTVKKGITRKDTAAVKNPVKLAPMRSFAELSKQPSSNFVFRMRSGDGHPSLALFEADGDMWMLEAIASIKDWFKTNMEALKVVA